MITAKLLNSNASLNDFSDLGSIEFIPGENIRVSIQLIQSQKGIRFVPPVDATVTLKFLDKDGETITKTASVISNDDRSLWTTTLTQDESAILQGQNIEGVLDVDGDQLEIYKFILNNVLQRINLSGDC